jgi:hypothetical protein
MQNEAGLRELTRRAEKYAWMCQQNANECAHLVSKLPPRLWDEAVLSRMGESRCDILKANAPNAAAVPGWCGTYWLDKANSFVTSDGRVGPKVLNERAQAALATALKTVETGFTWEFSTHWETRVNHVFAILKTAARTCAWSNGVARALYYTLNCHDA